MKKIKSNSAKYFNSLLPAPTCVICGSALPDIGGRRIACQSLRGMAVHNKPWDRDYLIESSMLVADQKAYLTVWGEPEVFTKDVVQRIKDTFLSGYRPWMCSASGCGHRQCMACGKGENFAAASDILYDDGGVSHAPYFMGGVGCTNPVCDNFREMGEGWGVVKYEESSKEANL